jgi:hypothetical protein
MAYSYDLSRLLLPYLQANIAIYIEMKNENEKLKASSHFAGPFA